MADTWSYAAGVWTYTMDGSGSGQASRSVTITGLTPNTLHTFYATVTVDEIAVGAFIEVDGGARTTATAASATLAVQGTTDGSGNITLRRGVADAGAAPSGLFFEDDLDYADIAALEAGGWTVVDAGGTVVMDTSGDLDGNSTAVLKCGTATGANVYITRTLTVVNGRTYTATVRIKNGQTRSFDTGTRLDFIPGGSVSHNTTTWTTKTLAVVMGGTSLEVQLGRYGDYFGLPGTWSGLFHGLQIDDGTGGGGAAATWTDWDYCVGTGLPTDPPVVDPVPDPPPGGYPPPPVGGTRPFGIWDIPAEGGVGLWTMTAKRITTSNAINILNASATGSMMNMIGFGSTAQLLDGSGRFSYTRWKALVDACYNNAAINARMATAITNGEWWAHFILDEPNRVDRWGMEIPFSVIEQMCMYSKSLWPTLRVVMRVSPILDWWRRANRHMNGCDTVWGEYLKARGTVQDYVTNHLAACETYDHTVAFGIHYGAFDRSGTPRYITPSELRQYGGYIAGQTSSRIVALGGWKYYSGLYNQPGFFDALKYVRDLFASHDP